MTTFVCPHLWLHRMILFVAHLRLNFLRISALQKCYNYYYLFHCHYWFEMIRRVFLRQSDDPAFDTATSISWGPTTTQSASASVLLGGRTKFPGTRAKRACAAVDDLCAKKRSRGASTTCDVASLSFSPDYSDWSTDRLMATTQLVSQSDTSVGSSMWSRM